MQSFVQVEVRNHFPNDTLFWYSLFSIAAESDLKGGNGIVLINSNWVFELDLKIVDSLYLISLYKDI